MTKKATCCTKTMGQSASAEVSTPASADRLLMIATQHVVKARITTISTIGHALPARPDCSGLIGKPPRSPPLSHHTNYISTRPAKVQRSCQNAAPLKTNSAGEPRIARFQTLGRGDG